VNTQNVKTLALALFTMLFVACTTGPCRELRDQQAADAQDAAARANSPGLNTDTPGVANQGGYVSETPSRPMAATPTVMVYKPDGSLQCGMGKPIPVQEMEKQLQGIRVISRENRHDGMMHIQVCGAPTGMINVYEIPSSSLSEAESRGFKKFELR
jgi:hypothetical protein